MTPYGALCVKETKAKANVDSKWISRAKVTTPTTKDPKAIVIPTEAKGKDKGQHPKGFYNSSKGFYNKPKGQRQDRYI